MIYTAFVFFTGQNEIFKGEGSIYKTRESQPTKHDFSLWIENRV